MLEDVEGALWQWSLIRRRADAKNRTYKRIVIGVDPSISAAGTGDECGVVAFGVSADGAGDVLMDRTLAAGPDAWARAAILAYQETEADAIVYETNQGGEMVANTLRLAATNLGVRVRLIPVHATRGKLLRAEPVVALYEQGLIEHAGVFPKLEEEMTSWVPGVTKKSPNRIDALVYAATECMVLKKSVPSIVVIR